MSEPAARVPLMNVPNLLSLTRVPLAAVVFACIVHEAWLAALCACVIAPATDWADGWWARRYGPLTLVRRNLDPLTDKILVCGTFIYLIPARGSGIEPWIVTVVVCRELLVTGLRGMVEASGKKFGADWFGKLKMALQCGVLIGVLLIRCLDTSWRGAGAAPPSWGLGLLGGLEWVQFVLLWLMLAATIGSGVQYVVKGTRLLK